MSFAQKTASAGAWVVAGKLLSRCLDLVTLLFLSRLLTPADFGLVAMAMSVVVIAEALLELPLTQALVRVPELGRPMLDTAFTLGVLRGCALALALGALAWPLSEFYGAPDLPPLICALALAPILRGTLSPRMVIFMRDMDFRREFALDLCGKLVSLVVAVGVALATRSHWAIVAATISTPLAMNILSYRFAPHRPRLSLREWASFRNMIGWNSVAQLFTALNWQIDRLLLGRFVSQASLGRFSMASDLAGLPNLALIQPLLRPLLAAFSLREDPETRTRAYLTAMNAIVMLAAPVLLTMSLLAAPLVRLVLGESWDDAAAILRWLALIAATQLPIAPMVAISMAMDRTKMVALRATGEFAVRLPAILIGVTLFGIPGVIAARGLTSVVALGIGMTLVRRITGIGIGTQVRSLWRSAVALAAMALVLGLLAPDPGHGAAARDFAPLLAATAGAGAAGALTFLGILFGLWRTTGRPDGAEHLVAARFSRLLRRG